MADNLASGALLVMGEAAEKIPFALREMPCKIHKPHAEKSEVFIRPKDCLFGGVIKY